MTLRFAALGLVALILFGCGEDESPGLGHLSYRPLPGCEHIDPAPCDTAQTSCQRARLELAACLRGSDPGELPPITVWTEQEYAAALDAMLAETPRPVPDHYERALSLLQLVEPGAFSRAEVVMNQATRVWGFYDPEVGDVTIIDHGQRANDARSNALLLHELVHALQDRDVDLDALYEGHDWSFDSMLALASIIEGEAELHESHYAASLLGLDPKELDWPAQFANRIASDDHWVLTQGSPLMASRGAFPYAYGQRFVDFAMQAGGHDAVLGLFAAPPTTTQVLMASVESASAPPSVVEIAPLSPPDGWASIGVDTLGAWSLYLVLARGMAIPEARSVALSWRGDQMSVFSSPSPSPGSVVVWQLELADETNAGVVETKLKGQLGSTWVRRQGTRVVAGASTSSVALDWVFVAP